MDVVLALAWYLSGVAAFVFFWVRDGLGFEHSDVVAAAVVGLLGPLAWPLGLFIHGP